MKEYTPIMKQYIEIKNEHKDKILFFRMGDFYEFFFDDAKEVSEILSLVLTSRGTYKGKKVPMAGFPKQTANYYISKLMKLGKKIAICEQIAEKKKNGLIERKVIKIITPGTFIPEEITNETNYICSIILYKNIFGISFLDTSANHFFINKVTTEFDLYNEIDKIMPKEIIIPNNLQIVIPKNIFVNKIEYKTPTKNDVLNLLKKYIKKKK